MPGLLEVVEEDDNEQEDDYSKQRHEARKRQLAAKTSPVQVKRPRPHTACLSVLQRVLTQCQHGGGGIFCHGRAGREHLPLLTPSPCLTPFAPPSPLVSPSQNTAGPALHTLVGLDHTANEVMALMSRSNSQSQHSAGGAGLLPIRGAQLHATAARPAAASKGSGVPAAGALPPPPASGSRFTVFGKNLTNVAPGSEQQVCAYVCVNSHSSHTRGPAHALVGATGVRARGPPQRMRLGV